MAQRVLVVVFALMIVPATADAVTIRDIIALSKAGLSDEILSAVIDADRTIFTLDPEQILELKRAGVSDRIVLKMVRSRREFDDRPAETTTPSLTQAAPPQQEVIPQVVIIGGESKEKADERSQMRGYDYPYYYVPFALWGKPANPRHGPPPPFMNPENRGFGRFINDGWVGRR